MFVFRSMVAPFFSQEHVNEMRPHIQETVDSLLEKMLKAGGEKPFDIVENFALPLPSYVSSSFFGRSTIAMPRADHGLVVLER